MESQIKSSFIPKDSSLRSSAPSAQYRSTGGFDLLVLASVVLLVASVALAIGVFLYTQYLGSSISAKQQQIARAKDAMEPALVNELVRLDKRLQSSTELLAQHIAPSALFAFLEKTTLQTVSFSSLDLVAQSPSNMEVKLEGVAASVNSIALQADLFGKSGVITSPIFSDISRQGPDKVKFNVEGILNPAALRYSALISHGGAIAPTNINNVPMQQTQQDIDSSTPTEQGGEPVPTFTP